MKPEAQRIAIAEACGWWMQHGEWIEPCGENKRLPPDYPNDLNACHEMEKRLPVIKVSRYISEMWAAMCRDCKADEIAIGTMHATAAQRCEAFLRTIGKWTEEKG